jgi:hypothetical protein
MTVLEALAILEAATRQCKQRHIDTAEVTEALDFLERTSGPRGWSLSTGTRSIGPATASMIARVNSRCFAQLSQASETQ